MAGIFNFLRKAVAPPSTEKPNMRILSVPWTVKVDELPKEAGNYPIPLEFEAEGWSGQKMKWLFYLKKEKLAVKTDGNAGSVDYIGAFLRLIQAPETAETTSIMALFSVHILNPTAILYSSSPTKPYDYRKGSYGLKRLLAANELPQFTGKDGYMRLLFTLELLQGTDCALELTPRQNVLCDQSESRCRKEIGYNQDITKIVTITTSDGFKYYACKPVLEARSRYFKAELKKLEKDADLQLNVKHSHDVFKVIFCHILHGHLIPELLNGSLTKLAYVVELAKAAELYGLDDLRKFLSDYPGLTEYLAFVESNKLNNFEADMSCEEMSCDETQEESWDKEKN